MVSKQPIFPEGVRQIPKQFSWLDHRLIRDHHIEQCSHPAAALYLFLVTVGDARGLSYYADDSIMRHLSMDHITLEKAGQKPLYQVRFLDITEKEAASRSVMDRPLSMGDILKRAMGGTSHD